MKHVLYVIYVLFYASAVFLAGLFAGQWLERKNVQKKSNRTEGTDASFKNKPRVN